MNNYKYFTIGYVTIIILLYFNCLVLAQHAINSSGSHLFVEAIQHQGANPCTIHSGKVVFTFLSEQKPNSEEMIQKSVNMIVQHYEEELKNTPKDTKRYKDITNKLRNKELIEKDCRETSLRLTKVTNKQLIIFRGGTPFTDVKQEIFSLPNPQGESVNENEETTDEKKPLPFKLIGNNIDPFGRSMNIVYDPVFGGSVTIQEWGMYPINELGRARGHRVASFTALFLLSGTQKQMKDFSFNQSFIEQFIALNDDLVKNTKTAGIRVTGQRDFEGSLVWVITIPQPTDKRIKNNKINGKTVIWVDPTRGYICPLIEEYVQDICVVRYESSDYYQDKSSGIWFPRKTVDTEFDLVTKEQLRRTVYEIIPEETDFNIPINNDEFVFPVSAGWTVTDRQSGRQTSYRVVRNTKLKFENGRIALHGNRDFIAESNTLPVNSLVNNDRLIRMFCIVIGVIFVLFALFCLRRKTK
ncbi:MAG: hypothetical protein LBF88_10655 [Planctomycetaceae bacterium]|jgi:hypothetical protein|nr:hypothetical protein [Planctomycetaceae bacterium]